MPRIFPLKAMLAKSIDGRFSFRMPAKPRNIVAVYVSDIDFYGNAEYKR